MTRRGLTPRLGLNITSELGNEGGGALDELFWIGLGAKMLATACIVLLAAKIIERSDAFIGAMVATLPVSAGPAYVFLAMEHDDAFIATASLVSLNINTGVSAFITVYAYAAQRLGAVLSTLIALAIWLVLGLAMSYWLPPLPLALAVNFCAALVAMAATRRLLVPARQKPTAVSRWWDLPFRAALVMSLVAGVLIAARLAGPWAAGIGALTPVVLASLTLILHPRIGGPASAEVMINCLPGMIGIASALAVLHVTAVPLGSPLALTLGLATCVVWNSMLLIVRQRRATAGAMRA